MITGGKELEKRLDKASKMDLKEAVGEAISYVQSAAKAGCPVENGELRDSIYASVDEEDELVRGTCYTDKGYAPYVEFGTGPKGQVEHAGVSPNVAVAYTQSPWWIHESQIDEEAAKKYHFPHIDTPQGRFYRCAGQPAQPYLYPALKDNEETIRNLISNAVKEQL